MTQFAQVLNTANKSVVYVQSADPDDLQNQVNRVIAAVNSATSRITNLTLAGGGDGHTFVVMIETADLVDAVGDGLVPFFASSFAATQVRCYLAGTGGELLRARVGAGIPANITGGDLSLGWAIVDEQLAGSAKGTRFMGMTVYESLAVPLNGAALWGEAYATATPQAISGGDNILSFENFAAVAFFDLPAPQTFRYLGNAEFVARFDVSATVEEQDSAGDVEIQVILDPLGAATLIGTTMSTTLLDGQYDNVSLNTVDLLRTGAVTGNNLYGVKVIADGAGFVKAVSLLITKL